MTMSSEGDVLVDLDAIRNLFLQAKEDLARAQAQIWQAPPHIWRRTEHGALRASLRALYAHYYKLDARFEAIDTRYEETKNIEMILNLVESIEENTSRIRRFFTRFRTIHTLSSLE